MDKASNWVETTVSDAVALTVRLPNGALEVFNASRILISRDGTLLLSDRSGTLLAHFPPSGWASCVRTPR